MRERERGETRDEREGAESGNKRVKEGEKKELSAVFVHRRSPDTARHRAAPNVVAAAI